MLLAEDSQLLAEPWLTIAGIVFALVLGAIVAYLFTQSSVSDVGFVRHTVGSWPGQALLATIPMALFSAWHVANIGPLQGIAWAVGAGVSMLVTRQAIVKSYASSAATLPLPLYRDVQSLVKRTIFQKGHSATEKIVERQMKAFGKIYPRLCNSVVSALHDVVHSVRDAAVTYTAEHNTMMSEAVLHQRLDAFHSRAQNALRDHLRNPLEKICHLFETLLGNTTDIWVALRVLDAHQIDGQRTYRTLLRVGHANDDRENFSQPIPEKIGLPNYLREQYQRGYGIVVLNTKLKKSAKHWHRTDNDNRREDPCTIAGPVVIKSDGFDGRSLDMAGILYVNSRLDELEFKGLEEYLKCCTDALSLFFCLSPFPKVEYQMVKKPITPPVDG